MRLTTARPAGAAPFEGDLVLLLHGLPPDAVVTAATVAVAPAQPGAGDEPFAEEIALDGTGAHGSTVTSGPGFVEIDFHARRTLRSISGSGLMDATLQADVGGLFLKIATTGAIAGPDDEELTLEDDTEAVLPGLAVSRFRLSNPEGGIDVDGAGVRSVPTNVSVRVGTLPPFWTRVGEVTVEETSPDFAPVLREALRDAEVVNGSKRVDLTVHSDTLCRLDVTCTVDYVRSQAALPEGLPEATLAFDHGSLPNSDPALVSVSLPAGATVSPGGTAGRLVGSFDSSRVVAGALGDVAAPVMVSVVPERSQAHPIEVDVEERIAAVDLLLLAAPGGAGVDVTLVSDADGKPWDQPLLAKPVKVRVAREPGGGATWVNAPLPAEVRLESGRRYWVVLQCLEGAVEWAAEPAPPEAVGLQTSLDGGLSWRASTSVDAAAPLRAFVRLRKLPATFEMPVRVEVGSSSRIDLAPGRPAAATGPAKLVVLDRFAPLGRLELSLDFPELGAALDAVATETAPSVCPEVEHLSNGDFSRWVKVAGPSEDQRELPEDWELTAGDVWSFEGARIGSHERQSGLSQVTPVAAGCPYRLSVVTRGQAAEGVDATVELLWLGGAEPGRVDRLELPAVLPGIREQVPESPTSVHGLDVVAPADATQVEVRFLVSPGAFLYVGGVSLGATADELSNGDLRLAGEDGIPSGWSLAAPVTAADLSVEAGSDAAVLGNEGSVEARLSQRVAAGAGARYEVELEATVPDDVPAPPRLEIEWLDAAGAPATAPVVQPLAPGSFDTYVLRGAVPSGSPEALVTLVLPPESIPGLIVEHLAVRFPTDVPIPLTFVADAPGELTLTEPRVLYDVPPPALPPIPPGGLSPVTPPGKQPGTRDPHDAYCRRCCETSAIGHPEAVATAGGREARHGTCTRCGAALVTLGQGRAAGAPARAARVFVRTGPTASPRGARALPTTMVSGVGERRADRLAAKGIRSVADLGHVSPDVVGAATAVGVPTARAMIAEAGDLAEQGTAVHWIDKPDRFDPHERIRAVGGIEPDGTHWRLTQEEAIAAIEDGELSLYVEAPAGDVVRVVVARRRGRKYLKTEADGDRPNNLLSLPDFPPEAVQEVRRRCACAD
jgi:hypothetical protein